MDTFKIDASQCVLCGGRLRNAVFCPACGHSSCSWACYLRHLAQHTPLHGRHSSPQGNPSWYGGRAESVDDRQACG